jgi:hypothetical protein
LDSEQERLDIEKE